LRNFECFRLCVESLSRRFRFLPTTRQLLFCRSERGSKVLRVTRRITVCIKQRLVKTRWDMMLQFESELSGADRSSAAALQNVEKRKHEGLMRPDEEDVAT
jgi:hypothetical protein